MDSESPPPASVGEVVAQKYRLDRVLGSGGMGTVFAATHLDLDTTVAIKVLHRSAAATKGAVDRFAREARACARLRSENVVRVTDVGLLPSGVPYMVMEYLEGTDLEQLLRASGPLPVEDAVDYVVQACAGLAEAHAAGIVHRDLKPANLFLAERSDARPVVKVVDFGIAKVALTRDNLTKTGDVMGSPLYMSPEQLASARDTDARADVWALGVILHELVAGTPPFDGETIPQVCAAVLVGPPQSIERKRPDVPALLVRVLDRCLQKKPDERYGSVLELADALADLAPERAAPTLQRIARLAEGTPDQERCSRLSAAPAGMRRSTRSAAAETGSPWSPDEVTSLPLPLSRRPWVLAAVAIVFVVASVALVLHRVRSAPAPAPASVSVVSMAAPASAPPPPSAAPTPAAPGTPPLLPVREPVASATAIPRAPARPATVAAHGGRRASEARDASAPPDASAPSLEDEIRAAFPGAPVPALPPAPGSTDEPSPP